MSKHLDTNMGVNTGLDLLFVAKFQWGIAGAAIATILAQFLSAVLVLGYPVGWVLCSVLLLGYYRSGKWKKRSLVGEESAYE